MLAEYELLFDKHTTMAFSPWIWHDNNCDSVQEVQGCDWREKEEPEPQEQVDLLVDNVEAENTETVELLLACCCTNTVERATETKKNLVKLCAKDWVLAVNTFNHAHANQKDVYDLPGNCREDCAHGVW